MSSSVPNLEVWVVEDDDAMRKSLDRLLREGGYEPRLLASAEEFLDQAGPVGGCLLLDLKLAGMDGRKLQDELLARRWPFAIVFLTGHGDVSTGVEAMKQGAVDFLLKPVRAQQLFEALKAAERRVETLRARLTERAEWIRRLEDLSAREREVLDLVVEGKLNKQIAGILGIALRTVKLHRANMLVKLGVESVAELARKVERCGLPPRREKSSA